jgi:hypothetical protein
MQAQRGNGIGLCRFLVGIKFMDAENQPIKVIELRNYLIKPHLRERFIDYFEKHFVASQNVRGGYVLGAFRIKTDADRFYWIRGFSDMNSRSRFLPEFYGGEVWKEFGAEANEMMLEWHNVHLLKPLAEITVGDFFARKCLTVIDFYLARDDKIGELINSLQSKKSEKSSFWVSELRENDFPQLPVMQDENLLAAITNYNDEAEYESGEKDLNLRGRTGDLIKKHERLILTKAF